ncbi:MAG: restriction endonuclease [Acidobacteria bacterium]|nr:restriction endonuclease [Acidobacteriota bacterium]
MRRLDLQEWQRSEAVRLTLAEREALRRGLPSLGIEPATDSEHAWLLTPAETVGALEVGGLSVSIRPKLDVGRVLFLASYAMGAFKLREAERFSFPDADTLVEGLARVFAASARRAFSRGLVHGYRTQEEALHTVRGRIRFADQMRRRFGIPTPVEVRYDDFTEDVLPNRLVRRAAERLGRMRIRSPSSRADLAWIDGTLENVALVAYPRHAVPEVVFNRLNEHYREVVALARLVLRHATIETGRGAVRAPGFLMDMNRVFQEFVTRALRESLGLSDRAFRSDSGVRGVTLDEASRVRLRPDLSWWDGPTCRFVGDAKYKRVQDGHVPNADLYQLLAYATALDLPGGLLVYAQGETPEAVHVVRHAGRRLEVAALDLSGTIDDLRRRIRRLAERVRRLRDEGPTARRVA